MTTPRIVRQPLAGDVDPIEWLVSRTGTGSVSIRVAATDPAVPHGGRLVGWVLPLHDEWQVAWRLDDQRHGAGLAPTAAAAEGLLLRGLGITAGGPR